MSGAVQRYVAFSDRPDGGNPAGVVLDRGERRTTEGASCDGGQVAGLIAVTSCSHPAALSAPDRAQRFGNRPRSIGPS